MWYWFWWYSVFTVNVLGEIWQGYVKIEIRQLHDSIFVSDDISQIKLSKEGGGRGRRKGEEGKEEGRRRVRRREKGEDGGGGDRGGGEAAMNSPRHVPVQNAGLSLCGLLHSPAHPHERLWHLMPGLACWLPTGLVFPQWSQSGCSSSNSHILSAPKLRAWFPNVHLFVNQ